MATQQETWTAKIKADFRDKYAHKYTKETPAVQLQADFNKFYRKQMRQYMKGNEAQKTQTPKACADNTRRDDVPLPIPARAENLGDVLPETRPGRIPSPDTVAQDVTGGVCDSGWVSPIHPTAGTSQPENARPLKTPEIRYHLHVDSTTEHVSLIPSTPCVTTSPVKELEQRRNESPVRRSSPCAEKRLLVLPDNEHRDDPYIFDEPSSKQAKIQERPPKRKRTGTVTIISQNSGNILPHDSHEDTLVIDSPSESADFSELDVVLKCTKKAKHSPGKRDSSASPPKAKHSTPVYRVNDAILFNSFTRNMIHATMTSDIVDQQPQEDGDRQFGIICKGDRCCCCCIRLTLNVCQCFTGNSDKVAHYHCQGCILKYKDIALVNSRLRVVQSLYRCKPRTPAVTSADANKDALVEFPFMPYPQDSYAEKLAVMALQFMHALCMHSNPVVFNCDPVSAQKDNTSISEPITNNEAIPSHTVAEQPMCEELVKDAQPLTSVGTSVVMDSDSDDICAGDHSAPIIDTNIFTFPQTSDLHTDNNVFIDTTNSAMCYEEVVHSEAAEDASVPTEPIIKRAVSVVSEYVGTSPRYVIPHKVLKNEEPTIDDTLKISLSFDDDLGNLVSTSDDNFTQSTTSCAQSCERVPGTLVMKNDAFSEPMASLTSPAPTPDNIPTVLNTCPVDNNVMTPGNMLPQPTYTEPDTSVNDDINNVVKSLIKNMPEMDFQPTQHDQVLFNTDSNICNNVQYEQSPSFSMPLTAGAFYAFNMAPDSVLPQTSSVPSPMFNPRCGSRVHLYRSATAKVSDQIKALSKDNSQINYRKSP